MSHLLIAYAPNDLDALLKVHETLRQASIATWYMPQANGVSPTSPANLAAIHDAFGMVVLVSAASMKSKTVKIQLQQAIDRGLTLFPLRVDHARLSGLFRSALADKLTDAVHDDGALERLVAAARQRFEKRCPVIAVMNLKGGVGKTTVSAQVFGAWQSALGGRTLLVDLDPQYNLTQTFFNMNTADAFSAQDRSVISLFERSRLHAKDLESPAEDWTSIRVDPFPAADRESMCHGLLTPNGPAGRLDLISGQFEISKYAFAQNPLALAAVGANFRRMIDHYRSHYDLIVFDTNPNATFLTRCALEAADRVVVPMHPDVYSLRGVRLLNQVIHDHVDAAARPDISVLFNAVSRSEQSDFEADARNGAFDPQAGFSLSRALMSHALPRSAHLNVKNPDPDSPPWQQLLIHRGRGGGLRAIRDTLTGVAQELKTLIEA